jgi:UDP-GlcNAc3NAcA epimerase
MKICTIIGTRPQFIKAVLVSQRLDEINDIDEIIVNTNQHYDNNMSDVFFNELNIPKPKYNLQVNGMGHGAMTGNMMIQMEKIMIVEKPDVVLVYGDCDTTLAGGLVAAKLGIRLIHVESGLRSRDRRMPEELNRIVVDRISDVLLCPTQIAIDNLVGEGIVDGNDGREVKLTGDLMVELLDKNKNYIKDNGQVVLDNMLGEGFGKYILATIHRASNTNASNLVKIMEALKRFGRQVVIPLHPRTKKVIDTEEIQIPSNIRVVPPASYLHMMALVWGSDGVITDSGGLQKEAYAWCKKCATFRETTEWIETLDGGQNVLINPDLLTDVDICNRLQECFEDKEKLEFPPIYGHDVACRIVDIIYGIQS